MTTPTLTKDLHKVMELHTIQYRGCTVIVKRDSFMWNNQEFPSYKELDMEIERVLEVIISSINKGERPNTNPPLNNLKK